MATVRPFRALRYDLERADLARVLAPASEKIDDDARDALYAKEPRNAARVTSSRREHGERAEVTARREAFVIAEWRRAEVLKQDDYASFYVLRQTMPGAVEDDEPQVIEGFFAVIDLDDKAVESVLAHESADDEEVEAVRARMQSLGHHVEPVLLVHDDKKGRVERTLRAEADRDPDARAELDGTVFELWVIDDESTTARVAALLEDRPLFAAAGDARLHAGFALARERHAGAPDAPPPSLLAWITPTATAQPLVRPIHRAASWMGTRDIPGILGESQRWFRRTELAPGQQLRDGLAQSDARVAFGMWLREGGCFLFELLDDVDAASLPGFDDSTPVLDITVAEKCLLQSLFGIDPAFGDVRQVREDDLDLAMIDGVGNDVVISLRAPSLDDIIRRVSAGAPLPAGTTTLEPLPAAGFVFTQLVAPGEEDD